MGIGDSLQNSLFASKNSRFLVFLHAIFVFLTRQNVTLTHENPALMDGKHNFVRPQLLKRGGTARKKTASRTQKMPFPCLKVPFFLIGIPFFFMPKSMVIGRGMQFFLTSPLGTFFPRVVKKRHEKRKNNGLEFSLH